MKPVKNHFYNVLEFTKQFEKEVRERGEELRAAKKQGAVLPKGAISYDFDGKVMPKK